MSDGPRGTENSGSENSGSENSGEYSDQDQAQQDQAQQDQAQQDQAQQPWDRPRRWNSERLDATRVDDLLARLKSNDDDSGGTPRRRRRFGAAAAAATAASTPAASSAPTPTPAAAPSPSATPTPAEPSASVRPPAPVAPPVPASPPVPTVTPSATPPALSAPATPSTPSTHEDVPAVSSTPEESKRPDPEATVIVANSTAPVEHPSAPSTAGTPWPASSGIGAGRVAPVPHDSDSTEILPVVTDIQPAHDDAEAVRESLRASLVTAQPAASVPGDPIGSPKPARVQKPPTTSPSTTSPPNREQHHYVKRVGSVVIALISAFVLGATGVYANIVGNAESGLDENRVSLNLESAAPVAPTAAPTNAAESSAAAAAPTVYAPENFLLVGSDTRAGANNIDGGEAELGGEANTDSLMVLHLSGDRQQITVISLPRDMWADNVPCKEWDSDTDTYGNDAASNNLERQHINAFYGVGGPQCLVDAVEKLTNLQITRYIQIDFSGFSSMVDALGGVTINACKPIIDEQLATVLPNAGVQVINGQQALNLARARKVIGDEGVSDPARIHRQQLILSAILRQVKSTDTLLDPGKLNAFVQAFTDNTNTFGVDFQTLLDLAESLGDLDPAKVTFYTLPTVAAVPADNRGSLDIDQAKADLLLNAIRTDTPVPGTEPTAEVTPSAEAPTTTAEAVAATLTLSPAQINLTVVNAADRDGVAGEAQTMLNGFGYDISENQLERLDPADTQDGITVEYSAGNEAAALTVAASAPGSTLVVVEDLADEVRLVLGTTYAGSLVAANVGDPIAADLLAQVPAGAAANVITPTEEPSDDTSVVDTADASAIVAEIPQVNAASGDCL